MGRDAGIETVCLGQWRVKAYSNSRSQNGNGIRNQSMLFFSLKFVDEQQLLGVCKNGRVMCVIVCLYAAFSPAILMVVYFVLVFRRDE